MVSQERKAKLRWQCRRGMLELDLILTRFLERCMENLTQEQITSLENLLLHPDPDIYAWLMGYQEPDDNDCANMVAYIKRNNNI